MSTQPDQQKRPNAKMRKKCKKLSNIKKFSSLVSLTRHFTKFIFLEQLTAVPQFNMQNMYFFFFFFFFFVCLFVCFFLSSHHDSNPLLHLYHFRKKKYNYILANIDSESSRVIFSFFLSSSSGSYIFVPQQILKPFEAQC